MSSWHCSLDFFGEFRLAVYGAICQLEVCFNTWLWSQLNHVFVLHQFFFEIGVWDVMGKLWKSVICSNACVRLAIEWRSVVYIYVLSKHAYLFIYIYTSLIPCVRYGIPCPIGLQEWHCWHSYTASSAVSSWCGGSVGCVLDILF